MAFAKKGAFTFNHVDQQDKLYLGNTSPTIKQKFDSRSQEMRDFVNALIDALAATTAGSSGADNIGATSIIGLNGDNVQTILESMKLQLDNATAGALPDFSITMRKLATYKRVVDAGTKDAKGFYTTVRFRRPTDDTLAVDMVLSLPDANGYYTKDTWQFYDSAGSVVQTTVTWTYGYDADGNVILATPA